MKKVLLSIALFLLLVFVSTTTMVRAVAPFNNEEKKDEIQARLDEKKQLIEERKVEIKLRIEQKQATRQAQLTERSRERIRTSFGKLTNRFNTAITRLKILIERIESRIVKLDAEGTVDTSDVMDQIAQAKDLLNEAEADLEAARTSLEEVLDSDDPKVSFTVIKETVSLVKDKLKEVHNLLVHTIGDIKGLRDGLGPKTSTGSSTLN